MITLHELVERTSADYSPVPAVHAEHRRKWWEFVLREATPWHREHLRRLFDVWTDANESRYDNKLIPPYILLNEPSAPRVYGSCGPISGFGCRSQIRIRPSLLMGTHPHTESGSRYAEGRERFVDDVLLHEQIHQFQQEVCEDDEPSYHGHGPVFRDVANRIGATLELPPVRTCKKRGPDKGLPSCSQWPHNVRQADFYLGAYAPPSRKRTTVSLPVVTPDLVVTLSGDPEEVADRLIHALGAASDEVTLEIVNAIRDRYGPEEWHARIEEQLPSEEKEAPA